MIKIAQFSTNDIHGGAAIASYRLLQGLEYQDNIQIDYFVKVKSLNQTNIQKLSLIEKTNPIQSKYINNKRTPLTNTLFSFNGIEADLPDLSNYDIINLHWVEHFLSLENLKQLVNLHKPIIWTLHDQKPFTGGCHYTSGCNNFKQNCQQCLQLDNDNFELPQKVLSLKKEILQNANIVVVTPSKWLTNEVKKSSIFKNKQVYTIPNSINSDIFKPRDNAKQKFNISSDTIVLSFGVVSHTEKRKGFQELYKALEIVKKNLPNIDIKGLIFGKNSSSLPIKTIDVGYIDNEIDLSYIYSASDMFILPSLEDNLPNVILESMSCQTPVIAFDTGGAKDIINNTNGAIVPQGDVEQLALTIIDFIKNKKATEQKGKKARELILEKYQLHHQAQQYLKLYNTILKQPFSYKNIEIDTKEPFDKLIGYTYRTFKQNHNIEFSKDFNNFYNQIQQLKDDNKKYIIYGNGTISKTIQALIPEYIIGYVDMADKNNHPTTLINKKYDKIIISVLGREQKIMRYLIDELNINEDKIVVLIL